MKQIIINIPNNKYHAFIKHIKSKFTDIQIEEKKTNIENMVEEDSTYNTLLLSEKSLAEEWLSEEDNRWDEIL